MPAIKWAQEICPSTQPETGHCVIAHILHSLFSMVATDITCRAFTLQSITSGRTCKACIFKLTAAVQKVPAESVLSL